MLEKTKAIGTSIMGAGTMALSTVGLLVNGSGVTVEASDVANVSDANVAYLTSAFQITEFLGVIAIFAAGTYLLNKVFSFVPKSGN